MPVFFGVDYDGVVVAPPRPVQSPPPPPPPVVAPLPPQPISDALLQAAGVTREQVDEANTAALYAAAEAAAILAGKGSAGAAAAAQAAGAPQSVVDSVSGGGIPDLSQVVVGEPAAGADPDANANPDDPRGARGPSLLDDETIDDTGRALEAVGILTGDAFVVELRAGCAKYNLDTFAVAANALREGIGGAVGDGGEAYGPWQDWLTYYKGRPWYGAGKDNPRVQAWAWSRPGFDYVFRSMVAAGCAGRTGHDAVHQIVFHFEKPGNMQGEYVLRADVYDQLVKLGAGAWQLIATAAVGPGSSAAPGPVTGPGQSDDPSDAGVHDAWTDLMHALGSTLPAATNRIRDARRGLAGAVS